MAAGLTQKPMVGIVTAESSFTRTMRLYLFLHAAL